MLSDEAVDELVSSMMKHISTEDPDIDFLGLSEAEAGEDTPGPSDTDTRHLRSESQGEIDDAYDEESQQLQAPPQKHLEEEL